MRFELGYGAKNAPGRIMLRNASRLGSIAENFIAGKPGSAKAFYGYEPAMQDYANMANGIYDPMRKYAQPTTKEAAKGGLMSLRGYASGGLTAGQSQFVQDVAKRIAKGEQPSQADIDRLNKIETTTGKPVSPYIDTGTGNLGNKANAKAAAAIAENKANPPKPPQFTLGDTLAQTAGYDYSQAYDVVRNPDTGAIESRTPTKYGGITNYAGQQAMDIVYGNQMPSEYAAASDLYGQLASGLQGMANYTPQQVSAPTATAGQATAATARAQQATASQMGDVADVTAPELQYFQADRGGIRDVAPSEAKAIGYDPTLAEASNYTAAQMQAPEGIAALGYDAAQMQAAQMNRADVRDVNAKQADVERYNASLMNAPADIASQNYEAAQAAAAQANRGDIRDVTAPTATASTYNAALMGAPQGIAALDYDAAQAQGSQMKGPSSWTEAGTAEKYMNPYIQNVVDIEKREANRDYQRQLNELNKQAVGAKAYGGSRLAIERSEAARNQAMKLADIEAKGLNEAYQQGIGQFATEQGQSLQAGQANLTAAQQTALANQQALNSQRQTFVTQALEAARNNYGGQLTAEQQNQVAQNATAQFNAQNQTQISQINAQLGITAQQANQQADIGLTQLNTQNQQQTALANQASTNAQRSQYIAQALQAAQANYGGQLTAAQQNQIAQNAAAQFNSQSQNTAYNNYVAQQLAAQQANQQMDFGVGQLNTQMEQQANAANQAAINAQRSQYVTQQLEALKNNYGGELTAAQLNQAAKNFELQFNAQADMAISQYNAGVKNTAGQYYATALNQNSQFNSAQALAAQQLNQGMDAQVVMANLQANLGVDAAQAGLIMQGALANQQTAYNTGALNAQLGTNVSLQNAQLGTQANIATMQGQNQIALGNAANQTQISGLNAQLGAQVGIANQSADLTANQQGIGALIGAMGAGSGMLQSGGAQTDWTNNQVTNLGKIADAQVGKEAEYLKNYAGNASTVLGMPTNITSGPLNALSGTPAAPGGQTGNQNPR
jgi:hypothetical protein